MYNEHRERCAEFKRTVWYICLTSIKIKNQNCYTQWPPSGLCPLLCSWKPLCDFYHHELILPGFKFYIQSYSMFSYTLTFFHPHYFLRSTDCAALRILLPFTGRILHSHTVLTHPIVTGIWEASRLELPCVMLLWVFSYEFSGELTDTFPQNATWKLNISSSWKNCTVSIPAPGI